MDPKVTVILPSYNVSAFYEECIKSVREQTLKEIEILCVDAGSTDGTLEIIEKHRKEDARISLIHSEKKSYGYQLNLGLYRAKAPYVAIVETDDYITQNMYEMLYRTILSEKADFVKCDYDAFWVLSNNEKVFQYSNMLSDKNNGLYLKPIEPRKYLFLYDTDIYLWRGIYSIEFLNRNRILFSETPGASFQDAGFTQLVMAYAKKGVYLPDSFYRYRQNRKESSIHTSNHLMFNYQEEKRLLNEVLANELLLDLFWRGFYRRMSVVFINSYRHDISILQYETGKIELYYSWFCQTLSMAIENGQLLRSDMEEEEWRNLFALMNDREEYLECMRQEENDIKNERENLLYEIEKYKGVAIVGAGNKGKQALRFLDDYHIWPRCFCDNDPDKWEQRIGGLQIASVDKYTEDEDIFFLIANDKNKKELKEQLLYEKVPECRIGFY